METTDLFDKETKKCYLTESYQYIFTKSVNLSKVTVSREPDLFISMLVSGYSLVVCQSNLFEEKSSVELNCPLALDQCRELLRFSLDIGHKKLYNLSDHINTTQQ